MLAAPPRPTWTSGLDSIRGWLGMGRQLFGLLGCLRRGRGGRGGERRGRADEPNNVLCAARILGIGVLGHIARPAAAGGVEVALDGRRAEVLGGDVGGGEVGDVACGDVRRGCLAGCW